MSVCFAAEKSMQTEKLINIEYLNDKKVPFSKPDIIDKDIEKVVEVIKSGWLAHGKY